MRRPGAVLSAVLVTAAALIASLVAVPSAGADTTHDPFGKVTHVQRDADSIRFAGWAADPDARRQRAEVLTLRDGRVVARTHTALARPGISRHRDLGGRPGFRVTANVPQDGVAHTFCVAVRNVGPGTTRVLHCAQAPAGAHSPDVVAAHSPAGHVMHSALSNGRFRLTGWTTDPDFRAGRSTVVLYVDGVATETVHTTSSSARQRQLGAGPASRFSFTAWVGSGAHVGCVWTVNVGIGYNSLVGCRAVDSKHVGHGSVHESDVNKRVVRQALRHLGGRYVWGAEGPHHFDCSGLVQYSYHRAGMTLPRVARDQFHAAHKIPASRLVPGDLVFYHTGLGYVHHVGIYLSPGMTVAAIDPAEGIDYQPIDTSSATYGSFTHR
jgi:cell wall-associated NlpC family hydrolase